MGALTFIGATVAEVADEYGRRCRQDMEIGEKVEKAMEMVTAHLLAVVREEMNRHHVQVWSFQPGPTNEISFTIATFVQIPSPQLTSSIVTLDLFQLHEANFRSLSTFHPQIQKLKRKQERLQRENAFLKANLFQFNVVLVE